VTACLTLALLSLLPPSSEVEKALRTLPGGSLYGQVDAMLMDLGVSSMQLDTADRGFSFLRDGPIDMRMDPGASLSAEEVLNTYSEAELARIIRDYGEEKMWRQVARRWGGRRRRGVGRGRSRVRGGRRMMGGVIGGERTAGGFRAVRGSGLMVQPSSLLPYPGPLSARICEARERQPITTTQQLAAVVGPTTLGGGKGKKGGGRGIHPATRTFQALRIVVNDELGKLEQVGVS
jgi:16S rRNA C1402 N4-methylase RsmH